MPASAAAQRGRRPGGGGGHYRFNPPPPPPRRAAPEVRPNTPARPPLGSGLEKLSQLPPEQREQALRQDPGFQRLPPDKQQQMLDEPT
ncbi:MAG: hypothetical protein ACRD1L_14230, partial [Terriglobales bacterium]